MMMARISRVEKAYTAAAVHDDVIKQEEEEEDVDKSLPAAM